MNRLRTHCYPMLIALLLIGAITPRLHARGENKELYVVPAPANVVIDGSLDDWDFSGHVTNYVIPETRETQSARIAMMYDDEALYIGGIVRDSSPMMNRHDPLTNPARAWDADVCQIFFSLDPDEKLPLRYSSFSPEHRSVNVATMLLWYFTDREEPTIAMYRGMGFVDALRPDLHANGHIPAEHFEAAYRKGEDGLSYTFEYRLPWSTLALTRKPVANDHLAASVAIFWSRPDGLKTAGGAAWAWNVMSKPGFPFQASECWGTLIFSPEGNIPRELVVGHLPPEKPLPLTFSYDLPREGETTVQLFNEQNEAVRILVPQQRRPEGTNRERWDGLDDHGAPLPPGTYTWRGHVHDPIKAEYRFSVHNAGQPAYPTDNNRGGWGGDHGSPSTVLAIANGMILAWNSAEYGWAIIRVDLDGRKQWGSKHSADHLATDGKRLFFSGRSFSGDSGVRVMDMADSRPLNFQPGMATLPVPEGAGQNDATGLACDGQRIYVAYAAHNLIAVHALTGEMLHQWPVPEPGRLALLPDGALAVISGNRLITVRDGQPGDVIVDNLDSPRAVVVSPAGELHVAMAGAVQQVRIFDAAGKLLRSIGKEGGRPAMGRYDASGMYQPGGIDLDARGRLWVAETTDGPKRISVWDARSGDNLAEYFGSSSYFGYGFIDPDRPNEFYAHHVLWDIDWDTYKTTPRTTIWRKTEPNMMEAPYPDGYRGQVRIISADNGHRYMWGEIGHKSILLRSDGDLFKPFAAILHINFGWSLYRKHGLPLIDDNPETYGNGYYLWQDANDDQIVQADEIIKLPNTFSRANFAWMDKDLSVHLMSGHVLRPQSVTDGGQPVYDIAQAEATALVGKAGNPLPYAYYWSDDEGLPYTYGRGQMTGWTADGEVRWRYSGIVDWRRSLGMPITGPGRLWGMTNCMGVAGDYFVNMTYFGTNHIFKRDGSYIGALLGDGRLGGRGAYEGQPEGQGGTFVKLDIKGEERYFLIHGGQDSRVWEVMGLKSVQPLAGGTYVLGEEDADTARRAFQAWEAAKAGQAQLVIAPGLASLEQAKPVGKSVDDKRRFEARVAYDDANLYVRYDVTTAHQLINATPEDQLIFRGGNCLDLQLATDPSADAARKTPAPGDLRLLVTRRQGKPFAMLYRPRVAGFAGERIVLESPTGTEPFDRIEHVESVGLEYTKTESGFTALVTVPLELIGWKPAPGTPVRMDLGYIFGNATGTRAAIRAYWNNNSFSANVVDDIPNESRLEPAEWGEAEIN